MTDTPICTVERSEQGISLLVRYKEREVRFAYPPKKGTHRNCFKALSAGKGIRAAQGIEYALLAFGAYHGTERQWKDVQRNYFFGNYTRMPSRMLLIPRGYLIGDSSLSGVLFEEDLAGRGFSEQMQIPDLSHWTQRNGIYHALNSTALFIPNTAYEGKSFEEDSIAQAHFSSGRNVTLEGAALFAKTARDAGRTPCDWIAQRMKEIKTPEQRVSMLDGLGDWLSIGGYFWDGNRGSRAFGVRESAQNNQGARDAKLIEKYEVKSKSRLMPVNEHDILIDNVLVQMPTQAEQHRENLRQLIEHSPMDSEKFERVAAVLKALQEKNG